MSGVYDEALERFHTTGPEFHGWLSNHGPMAADALVRMNCAELVGRWVDGYALRLEPPPGPRWPISDEEWRDLLGDASRLGDWLAFFDTQLAEEPWRQVLARWWPRLLPGAIASATHGLIRTGHAVRALLEEPTGPRIGELGQALGYWAARWAPLPPTSPQGRLPPGPALAALPAVPDQGGARARAASLWDAQTWARTASRIESPRQDTDVATALDDLVDAAVLHYRAWAPSSAVMLVHLATAPRAAGLVLPALPPGQRLATYTAAWNVTAAIGSMYRPVAGPEAAGLAAGPGDPAADAGPDDPSSVAAAAARNGDEHVIKFSEVAIESHRRGNAGALPAARTALALIP
jgi:hypothetical protein